MVDFNRNVHCLLGLPVDAVTLAGAVSRIHGAAKRGAACFLSTPNLNFVTTALADPAFRASLQQSDLVTVDGMPLVWIARLLGLPIRERVAGSSIFAALRGTVASPPGRSRQTAQPLSVKAGRVDHLIAPTPVALNAIPAIELIGAGGNTPRPVGPLNAWRGFSSGNADTRLSDRPSSAAPGRQPGAVDGQAAGTPEHPPSPPDPASASALALTSGEPRLSVFFFGGPPGAAQAASEALKTSTGGLGAAGWHDPGFVDVEAMSTPTIIGKINASGADFLAVALGARKGQEWIMRNRASLTVPVISHLGAVVNFAAGTVKPAPRWMQRSGLEWLWRIKEEPALWRRYARDAVQLARLMLTRVLPLAMHTRLRQWLPAGKQSAAISVTTGTGRGIGHDDPRLAVQLAGDWRQYNLAPLRRCLAQATQTPRPIAIDLAAVRHVDSAFIGILLLLHGHQQASGQPLHLTGAHPALRRHFRHACAGFLLDAPAD